MRAQTKEQAMADLLAHNLGAALYQTTLISPAAGACVSAAIEVLRDVVMHPEDRADHATQ